MFPPSAPNAGALARLRVALASLDFTEAVVRERAGVGDIHEFQLGRSPGDEPPPTDATAALIRLFMEGGAMPPERVRALLGPELTDCLASLEMLAAAGPATDALTGTVALYPVEGLYIVSDRGSEFPLGRADAVFPAINFSGRGYLAALPRTPCESFLEVCSGSGIAAVLAARTAGHAWASDIAERSTLFARFNAALNGCENVTAVQGDMYEPLDGRRFDRIVAHPPYVPAFAVRQIYRDGGLDGEALTRRVIAEAPEHLAPGGRLYCTCMVTERDDAPVESRVREMLGESGDDCDVLVAVSGALPPIVHFTRELVLGRLTLEEAGRLVRTFEDLGVARFCPCTIVLQRRAGAHRPLTLRRERSGFGTVTDAIDALLRWEAFAQEPDALDRLAGTRPRLSPRVRLQVTHAPADGEWKMDECRVIVDAPLPTVLNASPNAAVFLAWCDGTKTLGDHVERLIAQGITPPDEPLHSFAGLVLPLLREGVLEAELPGD